MTIGLNAANLTWDKIKKVKLTMQITEQWEERCEKWDLNK